MRCKTKQKKYSNALLLYVRNQDGECRFHTQHRRPGDTATTNTEVESATRKPRALHAEKKKKKRGDGSRIGLFFFFPRFPWHCSRNAEVALPNRPKGKTPIQKRAKAIKERFPSENGGNGLIYRQVLDFEFSRRNVFRGAATNCCIPAIPQFYIDSRLRGSPPPIELHAASTKPIPKAAAVCYRSANGFFFFFFSRPLGLRFGLCLFFFPYFF